MARLWQQIIKGEKGQALPIVLALLVVGGLLVAPCLNYASTSLFASQMVKKNVKGIYAADAGVEDALWCLKNSVSLPTQLPENVNQMAVTIETEDLEEYALYYGELIEVSGKHYEYLAVDGEMVWDEGAEAYEYTIAVTWQAEEGHPKIHLEEVGVRLPVGYSYQSRSAESFPDNLSTDDEELEDTLDGAGAHMLNWELESYPYVWYPGPIRQTQTFYITGGGGLGGDYTWVGTHGVTPIGQVGEVIGNLYRITATARPGDTEPPTAKVRAYVLKEEVEEEVEVVIHIITWQINPQ